jgi:hypothetical protein
MVANNLTIVKVFKVDGTVETKTLDRPPTLQDYYNWIGCDMIQLLETLTGEEMVIDEDGKWKDDAAINEAASALYGSDLHGDFIVGTAVVQPPGTLK